MPGEGRAREDARRSRPRLRRALHLLLVVLVALGGASAALVTLGDVRADVGPVEAELAVVLSPHGGTEIAVPPVGRLLLGTHTGPLRLRAEVQNIDVAAVTGLVGGANPLPTVDAMIGDVRAALVRLGVRAAAVSLLGAVVATVLVYRRWRPVALGAVSAAVVLSLSLGTALLTYSSTALDEPQYDGLLAQAPALVGGFGQARTAVDAYGSRTGELTGNVAQLYGALGALPDAPEADTVDVLWVSDVHNNPATYRVMAALIEQFDLQAVLDTGDSTDLGSTLENRQLYRAGTLGVPYLWVRGNHDSAATQSYLEGLDTVTVLDGPQVVEVAGLTFAGIGDPRWTPVRRISTASGRGQEDLVEAGAELADGLQRLRQVPDVVLVHEPAMATPLLGQVPLVLNGHVHRRRELRADGTLALTLGSSGGAGLRTFDGGGDPLPLEMTVLHLDPVDGSLVAVDEVTVAGIDQQTVTFQRRNADSLAPAEDG